MVDKRVKGSVRHSVDVIEYPLLWAFAKENRNNPTEAERLLWFYLSNKQLGVRFRRQHIIGQYIADFACLEKMLIIELDGGYHSFPEQQISDEQRTANLQGNGYRVIRFTNEELFNGIDLVLTKINNALYENAPL
ncbi:MAG: endonuclease domain-containing protein [Bacteroidaceae bacterium]|nr:endonuclease domain-containing protein [Bacteroidaceae bacterium]